MKFIASCLVALAMTIPGLALADEEIGRIDAALGDDRISLPTIIATRGDEVSPTAYLLQIGGGMSSLNIQGYEPGKGQFIISLTYMKNVPEAQTPPIDMTIQYMPPDAGGSYWTSDDAPTPPQITHTTLALDGKEGRAVGTFAGVMCFAETYESSRADLQKLE